MAHSESRIGKDVVDWLIEPSNPSVRYVALRDLLGRPEDDGEVMAARAAISESLTVERIFAHRNPKGGWGDSESPYLPKYKATYWTVMLLGELALSPQDRRAAPAIESLFQFQQRGGGFSHCGEMGARREYARVRARRTAKGTELSSEKAFVADHLHQATLSCLTGNVVAALLRLGYGGDPRLHQAVDWLLGVQNSDGGWLCPYWKAHLRDWHGCFFGTIGPLEALSEIPEPSRTVAVRDAAARAAEFLLRHHLYRADHHGFKVIDPRWLTLSFPFSYNYTVLRGLSALVRLGIEDRRMDDARQMLCEKRTKDGRWLLESTPAGRMQTTPERKGLPSKWVTLACLKVLRRTPE